MIERRAVIAASGEQGFAMVVAILTLFVSSLLVVGALAVAEGDIKLTSTNTSQDKAYFAAQAAIQVYEYQLSANPNYWTTCPKKEKITVPGATEETYSYETLPATGHATCESGKQATIIESKTSANGTFRIKAVGEAGKEKRAIVATLTHPGFINYVFLSNYEIEDPSTIPSKPKNCEHYYQYRVEHGLTTECPAIPFIAEDELNGPYHTNDGVAICSYSGGAPTFGRTSEDVVEMNGGHYADSAIFGCGGSLNMLGTYTTKGATLLPPETDNELLEGAGYTFSGRTVIELKSGTTPNQIRVVNAAHPEGMTESFPTNGVIYVENTKEGCGYEYSPFSNDEDYEKDANCGNVYIKGSYTESLTVAAANDVIIVGNLTTTTESSGKPTGAASLGLIANKFVRVFHPVKCSFSCKNEREPGSCNEENQKAGEGPPEAWKWSAFGSKSGWGSQENLKVDAAILSTKNSWEVDNFMCGASLGELNIWGSIAQYWRGRVTAGAGKGGYIKSYNYDNRFATSEPPNFLAPTTSGYWKIAREVQPHE